ncbi:MULTISPECIES: hypothetical protein [Ramlibacter]|uniref:Uncharacterized protein n=1 Tax=Ramlibacter pinisoli TaxID=2682844 RepID=A0A6N8J0C3_9BURK|nr:MULTISPECIES: hypothetical protein [Ramlibacter]MBA2961761.1 hypothetical protein [Ramlibacter sp. CGMCC 1.13660]MVQ31703.1 hypothetical protein [Ramlibacter pinisoli]
MHSILSAKSLLAAAIALGSLAAVTGAHAQGPSNGFVSVTVGTPVRQVQPVAVHVEPTRAYIPSGPVHGQPRYVQAPERRDHVRGPWGDTDRDGIPNRYDRHDDRRVAATGPWGDADRDGVLNRYDRAPYNPRFR